MKLLRKYQLDIIFLFFALIIILGVYFLILYGLELDAHDYEWFLGGPLILFYSLYIWNIRQKINIHERRKVTGKTLFYWISLGIILFSGYSTPLTAIDHITVDIFFIVFTLFLADSYWDFRKLSLNILKK